MYTGIYSRTDEAFNFEDGLKVSGNLMENAGGEVIGIRTAPTQINPTKLQTWIYLMTQVVGDMAKSALMTTASDQAVGNSSNLIANTKFTQTLFNQKVAGLIGNSPSALNSVLELANAIASNPLAFRTIATSLALKATITDLQSGIFTKTFATSVTSGILNESANLVLSSEFSSGDPGGWSTYGARCVDVVGKPWSKALYFYDRDTAESNNTIPVKPSEMVYMAADLSGLNSTVPVSVGCFVRDAAGVIFDWIKFGTIPAGQDWTRVSSNKPVPAGGVALIPWLQLEGPFKSQMGYGLATNIFLGRSGASWATLNNAYSAPISPQISTLADRMEVMFRSDLENTSTQPTFQLSNSTPKKIVRADGSSLRYGDIIGNGHWCILQFSVPLDAWILMNPASGLYYVTATNAEVQAGTSTTTAVNPVGLKAATDAILSSTIGALDTIQEIASALGDNSTASTSLLNALNEKMGTVSPVMLGGPKAPTVAVTDNSQTLATTAFIKALIALTAAQNGIQSATTTVSGVLRFATVDELTAGLLDTVGFTPEVMKQIADLYMDTSDAVFDELTTITTAPVDDRTLKIATTLFVMRELNRRIVTATETIQGKVKLASSSDIQTNATGAKVITPARLKAALLERSAIASATETVVGLLQLATDAQVAAGVNNSVAITPAQADAAITSGLSGSTVYTPISESDPIIYFSVPYVLTFGAAPIGAATSIVSFSLSVKNDSSGATSTVTLPASGNSASYTLAYSPRNFSLSTYTFTLTAVDNLGNVSAPLVKTIPTDTVIISTPIAQLPTNNQTNVGLTPVFSVSGFDALNRTNASMSDKKHIQTEWIVEETVNGAVVQAFNSGFDSINLTTLNVPFGFLKYKHTYALKVRFKDEKYGWGAQLTVAFTTSSYGQIKLIQKLWNERATSQKHNAGAISANGKRIAVGTYAWYKPAGWGYVDIYDFENGSYVLKHTLQNTDPTIAAYTTTGTSAGYGLAVAMSADGNRIIVGCSPSTNTSEKGKLFIYDFDGTTWVLHSSITASSGGAAFGYCLKCSDDGKTIITKLNGSVTQGYIYVYNDTTSTWTSKATATIGTGNDTSIEVSADGLTCVFSNFQLDNGTTLGAGGVYIYTRPAGSYTWTLTTTLKPGGVTALYAGFGFGFALSRDGAYLLIAGTGNQLALYKNVSGVWTLKFNKAYTATDIPVGIRALGWSIALDESGFRGVIGDPTEPTNFGTVTGFIIQNDAIVLTETVATNTFQNPDVAVTWYSFNNLRISADGSTAISPNSINRANDSISQMPSFFVFRV
jgi:hypothetical protein